MQKAGDFSADPLDDGVYSGSKSFTAYNQYLNDNGALFKLSPSVDLGYTIDVSTYPLAKDDPNLYPYTSFESASTEAIDEFNNVTVVNAINEFNDTANDQLAEQSDSFQNRFADSQPEIEWGPGLVIADELQLYYTGVKGESGYSVWLADPAQLPFTTSATFAEDEALGRWATATVANQSWVESRDDHGTVTDSQPIVVQQRRGADAEIAAGTPATGELWFNTTDNTIHMGDGATPGGVKFVNVNHTATETRKGIAEIATQAEVNAGLDTQRIVSPNTLRNRLPFEQSLISNPSRVADVVYVNTTGKPIQVNIGLVHNGTGSPGGRFNIGGDRAVALTSAPLTTINAIVPPITPYELQLANTGWDIWEWTELGG